MTKIMLTGAGGLVGGYLLDYLLKKQYEVLILRHNRSPKLVQNTDSIKKYTPVEVVYKENGWKQEIWDFSPDIFIHCGGLRGEQSLHWDKYLQANVYWPLELFKLCAKLNVKKIIHLSTVGVYGTIPSKLPAGLNTEFKPDSKYHLSKYMSEKTVEKIKKIKTKIILRPTIIYGPGDFGFMRKVIQLMKMGLFPLMNKDFLIHLVDVKRLAILCEKLFSVDKSIEMLVTDDEPVSMHSLILNLAKQIGLQSPYISIHPTIFKSFSWWFKAFDFHDKKIGMELLSNSWYYENSDMKKVVNLPKSDTIDNLKTYIQRGVYD